jgi:hypothetical protein
MERAEVRSRNNRVASRLQYPIYLFKEVVSVPQMLKNLISRNYVKTAI